MTPPPPPPLRIRLLGSPALMDPQGAPVGIPVGKPLAVLTVLHLEGRIPRNDLATRFWPGVSSDRARASLRQALWLLRKALGDDILQRDDPVELAPGRITTDLDLLWDALDEADDPLPVLDAIWEESPFRLFLLNDLPEWEIWTDEVRTLAESRLGAFLEATAAERLRSGDAEACARLLERVTRLQPHRGGVWLARVSALLDARQGSEAHGVLAEVRTRFGDEAEWKGGIEALEERLGALKRREEDEPASGGIEALEFVGRSGEYARLHALWRAAREGSAAVALVTGDPGIGKTALAQEVARLAAPSGGRVVRIACREGDEAIENGLLVDLVKSLLGLSGAAGISTASDRTLRHLVPSLDTGPVESTPWQGAARPGTAALGDALLDLLLAIADDAPLLLFIDDLQWADPSSRSVLSWALRRMDRHSLLALLTCRTGKAEEKLRRELDGALRLASIPLQPLRREEVEEAVGLLAEFSPPEEADRVVTRLHRESMGNPLYLLEILRYLAEQGIMEPRTGAPWLFRCDALPEHLPLPSSVRGLVRASIRILPEESQSLLLRLVLAPEGIHPGRPGEDGAKPGEAPAQGVAGLLGRGLVRWNAEGALIFSHDEVRAAVMEELGDRRRRAEEGPERIRRRGWMAAALVGGFGLITAASLLWPGPSDPEPPPPYGGGTLFIYTRDEAVEVRPRGDDPTTWPMAPSRRFQPGNWIVRWFGLDPEGRLIWLENQSSSTEAPAVMLRREDGVERLVWGTPEDDYAGGIAPDGRSILVMSEDQEAEEFTLDLLRVSLEGGEERLLLRDWRGPNLPAFSPDGTRILASRVGAGLVLVVLRPDGEVLAEYPMEVDGPMIWCGGPGRILIGIRAPDGGVQLAFLDPEGLQVTPIPTPGYVGRMATCSPDGRAAVYQAAIEGAVVTVLHDLDEGRWTILNTGSLGDPVGFAWVADAPRAVPAALDAPSAPRSLEWGERLAIVPEVVYSDGSRAPVSASWASSDPSVVSVRSNGEWTANGLGEATITATWDGWLRADFPVQVTGDPGRGTVLSDDFTTLDPGVWIGMGEPVPVPGMEQGEPVLVIRGDGLHRDGLLLRDPLRLDQGVTVEMEFRMSLNGREGQRFQLCLQDIPLADRTAQRVDYERLPINGYTCLMHPEPRDGGESISLSAGFATQRLHLPQYLPSDDWIHVALQVRGDGEVTLVVNREPVARAAVHLSRASDAQWRVTLFGAGYGSELLVRQLRVWQGARY